MIISIGIGEIETSGNEVSIRTGPIVYIGKVDIEINSNGNEVMVYKIPMWEFEPESFAEVGIKTQSHDPCGHWHKGPVAASYEPIGSVQSVDIFNNNILFGTSPVDGYALKMYQYNIAERRWYWEYLAPATSLLEKPGTIRNINNFIGYTVYDNTEENYLFYYSADKGVTVDKMFLFEDTIDGLTGLSFLKYIEVYKAFDASGSGLVCCVGSCEDAVGDYHVVYRVSKNFGADWEDSHFITADYYYYSHSVYIDSNDKIWLCTLDWNDTVYIYTSINLGDSFQLWGSFNFGHSTRFHDIVINDSYVYLLDSLYRVYRSDKSAVGFSQVYDSSTVGSFIRIIGNGNTLWAHGATLQTTGIYKSTDLGETWVSVIDIENHSIFNSIHPEGSRLNNHGDKLVYCDWDGWMYDNENEKMLALLYSPDGGDTWEVIPGRIEGRVEHGLPVWSFTKSAWKY